MPSINPYWGRNVQYGPSHLSRDTARVFWTGPDAEVMLGTLDVVHANNFWCPVQLSSSRLIYTFYDMGFAVDPYWTTECNRAGCFDGVFRAAMAADWVVAISQASRAHYLSAFPHFPGRVPHSGYLPVLAVHGSKRAWDSARGARGHRGGGLLVERWHYRTEEKPAPPRRRVCALSELRGRSNAAGIRRWSRLADGGFSETFE